MNLYFLLGFAAVVLFIWTVGTYNFYRISRSHKAKLQRREVPPALRLAEQWMTESQAKMEKFVQASEQPLGAAQNELLELRLEAGRLPLGIKSLKLVKESMDLPFEPGLEGKNLSDLVGLYLAPEDFKVEESSLAVWKTPLGEMPCLELGGQEALTEEKMKTALARMNQSLGQNPGTGGFLYFPSRKNYQACLQNQQWMEGLKSQRLMVLDSKGLTALLVSLRLVKDTEKVVAAFQEGVDSTRALTGQSDKMNEALSRLSANSLKVRTGKPPGDLKG